MITSDAAVSPGVPELGRYDNSMRNLGIICTLALPVIGAARAHKRFGLFYGDSPGYFSFA